MTDLLQAMPLIQRRVKVNARRLKLRIEHHQIYLTIPPHSSEQDIQAFLKHSNDWLRTTWARVYAPTVDGQIPQHGEILRLPLLVQDWQIQLESALATTNPLSKPQVHDSIIRVSDQLNAGLILLPVPVLDYVLWHELCHTRQLNHSAKFWQEVAQVDAHYLEHRQQLKSAKLPAWWYSV
ncbi:MAG: DUF45 domain-containing protein [Moraxellaceae bacterium]|nr:MAG: DUF45 domain-containing protein [Moraxellaceae bacterium]